MKIEIVNTLRARVGAQEISLPPGTVVDGFQIGHSPEAGAYLATFELEHRPMSCLLYTFLPRTRIVDSLQ